MPTEPDSRLRLGSDSTLRAYLQLVRGPNLLTAMADSAMGFVFVRGSDWQPGDAWVLGLLMAASALLYASGVVLNDLVDVAEDARRRPERPLPSGRISVAAARWLFRALLVGGLGAATLAAGLIDYVGPAVAAAMLAISMNLYDRVLKGTPLGPPMMGACRLLNVALGMSAGHVAFGVEHWLVSGGIGLYVAGLTWFAESEAQRSSRLHLAGATVVIAAGLVLVAVFPGWADRLAPLLCRWSGHWGSLMLVVAAPVAWQCILAIHEPSPRRVQSAVRWCILWIVVLDAAVCYAVAGPLWGVAILALLIPATVLGRWIRLT